MSDPKREHDQDAKVELAKKVAEKSKKVANSYQYLETGALKFFHGISLLIDKFIFNKKFSKIVALIIAILLYTIVNFNRMAAFVTTTLKTSRTIQDTPVSAEYNPDAFELSGLPEKADIVISGDATSITTASSATGKVVANLEGLTEGVHNVKLTAVGYGDNVSAVVSPSTAIITLKKKTTQSFDLSYDLVNQSKMDSIYSVGNPQFDYTKVNIRASKDTLDSIAFVKALIDVSGQSKDFEQDARLVAYNVNGEVVNADIVPNYVHVKVPITSPNKTVKIEVQVTGNIPDNQAIESISLDQQTVKIYGNETVLSGIDKVVVTLNGSTLSKNATILRPITLPTGVSSADLSQVSMNVTLAPLVTKTIDNVPIQYQNNVNNYKATQPDNQTTTSVKVTGSQSNIDKITADALHVYIDMKDAKPGVQEFNLNIDQPANGFVKYELVQTKYKLNILGEKNEDGQSDGGTANNG